MRLGVIVLVCLLLEVSAFGEKSRQAAVPRAVQEGWALYVCSYDEDALEGRLVQFDAATGEKVADLSGVSEPVDVDVGPNRDIFVTDYWESNVRRFNRATGQVDEEPYGETAERLYMGEPTGLAFGLANHLYVADFLSAKVLEFDENGDFVQVLPDDAEDLCALEDVACDARGNIYVTQWLFTGFCDTPGVYKFVGDGWALFGDTDERIALWGLAFGPDGGLYVAEDLSPQPSGIYRYDGETGVSKGLYGETGSADKLGSPRYLTFGPDGDLYVSDASDSTVRKFSGPNKPDAGAFKGVFSGPLDYRPRPFGLVFAELAPELSIEKLQSGDMLLTLTGAQGKSYEVRYTTDPTVSDFTEWSFGVIIELEGKTSDTWTDDTAAAAPEKFYKAKEQ